MGKSFIQAHDEDLDFVMDSYQSGFSPIVFNEDFKARSAVMKKIAKRRAPRTLPILEQIENIVSKVQNGKMKEKTGMQKLLELSEQHGHPDLHEGILQKVGMINGASEFKPLAAFAKTQKGEHPMAQFMNTEESEEMTVKVKPRSVMGDYIALHGKLPKKELPVSMRGKIRPGEIWIRRDVYNNPERRERILGLHEQFEIDLMVSKGMSYTKAHKKAEKHEKEGWDPMTEDHPLAGLFNNKKEKPMIPAGFLRQTKAKGKKKQKGWDPSSDQAHPLSSLFKEEKKGRKK